MVNPFSKWPIVSNVVLFTALFALLSLLKPWITQFGAPELRLKNQIAQLQSAANRYFGHYREWPADSPVAFAFQITGEDGGKRFLPLDAVPRNEEGAFVDPWGVALRIQRTDTALTFTSAGEDKIFDTFDDIHIAPVDVRK